MVETSVIAALRQAVEAAPDNVALRSHLVEVLFRAGRWDEVLTECEEILARRPGDSDAMGYAAASAEALGRSEDAARYHLRERPDPDRSEPAAGRPPERVAFSDVAGMADVKRRIEMAVLNPLRHPEISRAYGKRVGGGLLLYGPPGCGKTYLARAIAGELGSHFVSAGLSDILDAYHGQSERNLADLFRRARERRPSVLFLDETDGLGRKRSLRHNDTGRDLASVLLAELDGVGARNDGVFMIGATNHPWDVDVALRRPGRLDRTVFVPPPDAAARRAIFERQMRSHPSESLDAAWLAERTTGFSGADVVHVCNVACELALDRALAHERVEPITMSHVRDALSGVKPSARPWFETARNFALFANAAGDWDDLAAYMKLEGML